MSDSLADLNDVHDQREAGRSDAVGNSCGPAHREAVAHKHNSCAKRPTQDLSKPGRSISS